MSLEIKKTPKKPHAPWAESFSRPPTVQIWNKFPF
jgi:hypothetical protein